MRRSSSGRDRGVATIWAACAVAALLVLATAVFWLGTAVLTRHRAGNAADLAALAAAGAAQRGTEVACARARWIAERMSVRVGECRFEGWDALVTVEAGLPGVVTAFGPARAHARAGPVG